MEAKEKTTFDEKFQDRVLACMQRVPEFLSVAAEHISPEYFDGVPRKNLAKMMKDFWADYNTFLTDPAFHMKLKKLVDEGKINRAEVGPHLIKWGELKKGLITDWKFVLDEMVKFVKHQRIKILITDSMTKHLPKGNYEVIEKEMAKIAGINVSSRVKAYDYFDKKLIIERQQCREEEMKSGKISISTGIKPLDEKLHAGGFYQGELYVFMAGAKRGKTMSLLWFSNQAVLQGYNVAHFSCEVSREICAKRLDAMNTKTLIKEVNQFNKDVAKRLIGKIPRGKLMLYGYPTKSLTPAMIEVEVDRLLNEEGVRVDMVVVDYLDIMRLPNPDRSSSWADQGPLAEELRRIAGTYSIPVITATQTNRGGSKKAIISGSDVAGNFEKIMIADEVFSLSATEEELRENKLRISNSESRNSETGTILISTAFAYGQFFADYIGEEI